MKTEKTKTRRARGHGHLYKRGELWWISVRVDSRQERESTGLTDEKAAEKYLWNRLKQVHAHELDPAKPFLAQRSRRKTVGDLLDALRSDLEIRQKWSPQAKSTAERVRRAFATKRALALTAEDVDAFIQEQLEQGYAKASINHSLGMLRQSYKLAELPAPKVRRLDTSDNVRTGFFDEIAVRRICLNLDADLADFTLFGWLTGMRRGEIASLRWQDVSGDELRLRAENSKNAQPRVIPFEGELVELI